MISPAGSRWLGPRLVLALTLGMAVLIGLGVWANALTEPVVRAGVPTGTVSPPPPKPTPKRTTPAPTPSGSATPSESAKPSKTPKPSAKPSKSADPFTTSSNKQAAVSGTGEQHTFIVKVETATKLDANQVATQVAAVLNDPRSWAGKGTVRFALVKDPQKADFTVYVSAPNLVDSKCVADDWVCVRGSKLVLGATGWDEAAAAYGDDITGFRRYLVNNAVGTYLGEKKATCKKAGRPAPVMASQTGDLKGCKPNPWPYG